MAFSLPTHAAWCRSVFPFLGFTPARSTSALPDPSFIDTLASVVVEALPDLSRPSMQQINEGNPVSLSIVNECADDATRRNFPAQFCV